MNFRLLNSSIQSWSRYCCFFSTSVTRSMKYSNQLIIGLFFVRHVLDQRSTRISRTGTNFTSLKIQKLPTLRSRQSKKFGHKQLLRKFSKIKVTQQPILRCRKVKNLLYRGVSVINYLISST